MKVQRQIKTTSHITTKIAAVAATALCIMFAPQARACGNPTNSAGASGLRALAPLLALGRPVTAKAAAASNQAGESNPSITGMWEVTMHAGGALYDHAYQQFYADGNEMQNSGIFPPEVGNVCYGIWKQQDARSFKLKHYGWLFEKGEFVGTFLLTATITVGTPAGGNTYFGTFVADVVLPSGKLDVSQHAEGTVQAVRLTID
jgi:hypothetical protein